MTTITKHATWLATAALLLYGSTASAQVFGTFSWQLQPYCNTVTLTITQFPAGYTVDGFEDGCGAGKRAGATGTAHINPDGSVGVVFTIVLSPSARPVDVAASVSVASGSGTWSDSNGNSGTFALGVQTPGLPPRPTPAAASRVAPPCYANSPNRYYDCGNGTVTDSVTGLIWLKDPSCFINTYFGEANQKAAQLGTGQCGLSDGSFAGDWRLPTKAEWEATIAKAVALGCINGSAPALTDDTGNACYGTGAGSSFVNVGTGTYWSNQTYDVNPGDAWYVDLLIGVMNDFNKNNGTPRPWPVRSGK